jgi:hypothetical protein
LHVPYLMSHQYEFDLYASSCELYVKGSMKTDLGQVKWVLNSFPLNPLAPESQSLGEVD